MKPWKHALPIAILLLMPFFIGLTIGLLVRTSTARLIYPEPISETLVSPRGFTTAQLEEITPPAIGMVYADSSKGYFVISTGMAKGSFEKYEGFPVGFAFKF